MKTTIEIQEALLREAKGTARKEGTTLRALVEEGLRRVLKERGGRKRKVRFRFATFKGNGLQPGIDETDWRRIREISYEGRGA